MKNLTFTLLIFLCGVSVAQAQAQSNPYYEFADHQWISSKYHDMIPLGPESAYLIQNASVVKVEGKTKTTIYNTPPWFSARFNIHTTAEDTTIYMYNYMDDHLGLDVITKIKINKDSIELINTVDDFFYYYDLLTLRLHLHDMITDSLGRTLAFHTDGIHSIVEKIHPTLSTPFLDTIFISSNTITYDSKLIKNDKGDLFVIYRDQVFPLLADYSGGSAIPLEEGFLKIKFIENNFYVLYEDHIAIYTNGWQDSNHRISIDQTYGKPTDFLITNNSAIVSQDSDQTTAQLVKYVFSDTGPTILYQETLEAAEYHSLKMKNDLIYSIGQHREVPVLGIQANQFSENDQRLNMRIEDIAISYTVETEEDCIYVCDDYYYDISYTVKNNSDESINQFTIAAYDYPLQFGNFPTLFARYNNDTLIMPGQTIRFEGKYDSQVLWSTFPFEIMGNNFTLDSNFEDSFVEFSDLILSTNKVSIATLPFQAYPNPAQRTINLESEEPIYKVDIYHIDGILIKSIQSRNSITQIDLPQLADGLYTLKIWDQEFKNYGIQKVMIQN